MQNLRSHPRSVEPEPAFNQDPGVIQMHINVLV